jgi:hypothetical protein
MEEIKNTLTSRLRNLKMYREDLDQLVALFGQCATVTISNDKFRYDSLDEMKAKSGPRIRHLDIRGEKPGVHFLLNQTEWKSGAGTQVGIQYNELRTEEISTEAKDLFNRIDRFLTAHQQPATRWGWMLSAIISVVATFTLFYMAIHT